MTEMHPLDPPPSNVVGVQKSYSLEQWETGAEHIKANMLAYLYDRLAINHRVPVGMIEGAYYPREDGTVVVRMRVPTAPVLMDFTEHREESDV